jgi:hypothetical protein
MPYIYILFKKSEYPEFNLPDEFVISHPLETKEEAESSGTKIMKRLNCDEGRVFELYMPINEFKEKYTEKGTTVGKKLVDAFLVENEVYNEKKVRKVANVLSQGMRDKGNILSKLNPELATQVATFFAKDTPTIKTKTQKHIEVKSKTPKKNP